MANISHGYQGFKIFNNPSIKFSPFLYSGYEFIVYGSEITEEGKNENPDR